MARMLLVLAVVAVCVVLVSASCKKHCERPGGAFGQYVCCDVHPGRCPEVRDGCPPVRKASLPRKCLYDPECSPHEKCCFDICIEDTVCKPVV